MVGFVQSLTPTLFSLMVAMGSRRRRTKPGGPHGRDRVLNTRRRCRAPRSFLSPCSAWSRGRPAHRERFSRPFEAHSDGRDGTVFAVFVAADNQGLIGSFGDAVTMKTAKLAAEP